MKRLTIWMALIIAAAAAVAFFSQVYAQQGTTPVTDDQVNTVARDLYCPVCENIPLDVCPTTACAQWRDLIRQKLGEGWTKQQIKDYFAMQYGDRVLGVPPTKGINWLIYVLPPVFIVAGGGLVVYYVRRMRKTSPHPVLSSEQSPAPGDEYTRRFEEELKHRS